MATIVFKVASTFECSDTGLSISDGTTGATVSATVLAGTVDSIDPEHYSEGTNTYTVTITVPSGYSNSGETIDCTATATGSGGGSPSPDPSGDPPAPDPGMGGGFP